MLVVSESCETHSYFATRTFPPSIMLLTPVVVSAIAGLLLGIIGCYIWREASIRHQLQQVLAAMETVRDREDISLPMMSQLRRRVGIVQQQQQALEQQLSSCRSVLARAPIGYLQVDAENQLLCCNHIAQQLLHIQKWESVEAKVLLELVRSYELDRSIGKTRSMNIAQELIWQFYPGYSEAADSDSIWLKASTIPLERGGVGVFIENQQSQVDAAAARERWLADLAHEVRTPLTLIRLVAETLQSKVTPDLTKWVDRMFKETTRLIDLVQSFLELSQLETAPNQYLRLEKLDLIDSIKNTWHTLEPIVQPRAIELIYTGPEQLLLELDAARFTQVFVNLLDNSVKYCPDLGHIWINVSMLDRGEANARIEIDLYDDGSGFKEKDLPHVFDRLYRGDAARQRQSPQNSSFDPRTTGSGLGLAIVRQIILAHGGTVAAHNHPTTGGAWIQLVLPDSGSKT
jgi:two-component system, OmpR family, phosphate regulon sensor histidine kinase PhoR